MLPFRTGFNVLVEKQLRLRRYKRDDKAVLHELERFWQTLEKEGLTAPGADDTPTHEGDLGQYGRRIDVSLAFGPGEELDHLNEVCAEEAELINELHSATLKDIYNQAALEQAGIKLNKPWKTSDRMRLFQHAVNRINK